MRFIGLVALAGAWVVSAPASAGAQTQGRGAAITAREIVSRSLHEIVGDWRIGNIRREAKVSTYHLADRDHVGPPYAADVSEITITDDAAGHRSRVARISSATGSTYNAETVTDGVEQVTTIREGVQIRAVHGQVARPLWLLDQPIAALRLALAAADLRIVGLAVLHQTPVTVIGFHSDGFAVRLFIGIANLLPLAGEGTVALPSEIAWASRGDVVERFEWQNWTMSRGVRQPYQVDSFLNGEPSETLSVTRLELDPPDVDRSFQLDPAGTRQLAAQGARDVDDLPLGRPDRPIAEIAPGVVQIPGSWYATLVRQPDGIVVIDAPISNGYSARVLAEAARRFPGVAVKAVVSTTGFNWHTAGLREYAARGIPLYALDRNEGIVRKLLEAPHTIRPDALARSRRRPKLVLVSDRLEIGSGTNRLQLLALRRASSPMMMVYLPGQRLLHTAEAVQPLGPRGSLLFPESLREVADEVADHGLAVDRMIGMHMSPTPWTAVAAALSADLEGRPPPAP